MLGANDLEDSRKFYDAIFKKDSLFGTYIQSAKII
jgi:hypothetical protein